MSTHRPYGRARRTIHTPPGTPTDPSQARINRDIYRILNEQEQRPREKRRGYAAGGGGGGASPLFRAGSNTWVPSSGDSGGALDGKGSVDIIVPDMGNYKLTLHQAIIVVTMINEEGQVLLAHDLISRGILYDGFEVFDHAVWGDGHSPPPDYNNRALLRWYVICPGIWPWDCYGIEEDELVALFRCEKGRGLAQSEYWVEYSTAPFGWLNGSDVSPGYLWDDGPDWWHLATDIDRAAVHWSPYVEDPDLPGAGYPDDAKGLVFDTDGWAAATATRDRNRANGATDTQALDEMNAFTIKVACTVDDAASDRYVFGDHNRQKFQFYFNSGAPTFDLQLADTSTITLAGPEALTSGDDHLFAVDFDGGTELRLFVDDMATPAVVYTNVGQEAFQPASPLGTHVGLSMGDPNQVNNYDGTMMWAMVHGKRQSDAMRASDALTIKTRLNTHRQAALP